MQPQLSLAYSSQAGNGLIGKGWSIGGLSEIHRCGETIYLDGRKGGVYYNDRDHFCLDGERLIYDAQTASYRTQHETWQKIIPSGGTPSNPDFFVVYSKDGSRRSYGGIKAAAPYETINRVWALAKVVDSNENYFTVTYGQDSTNGGHWPVRIDYTGHPTMSQGPYNFVEFVYGSRSDILVGYEAGSKARVTNLLTSIRTYAAGYATPVRTYNLVYQSLGQTTESHLVSITECGADGSCLPATTFSWNVGDAAPGIAVSSGLATHVGSGLNPAQRDLSRFKFGDFNADGKTDIYYVNGWGDAAQDVVYLSNGDGSFTSVPAMSTFVQSSDGGAKVDLRRFNFGDFNGDGATDIYYVNGYAGTAQATLYLSNRDGTFTPVPGLSHSVAGSNDNAFVDLSRFQLGDFDGDGRTDIYYVSGWDNTAQDAIYLSNGDGTFRTIAGLTTPVRKGPDNALVDIARLKFGDFDGDGLTDVYQVLGPVCYKWKKIFGIRVCVSQGSAQDVVHLSNGDGTYRSRGALVTNVSDNSANAQVDLSRFQLGDFNGDGKTDIYYVNGWGSTAQDVLYLSTGDGSFASYPALSTFVQDSITGATADIARFALGDFNGDGRTDIYYINGYNGAAQATLWLAKGDGTFNPVPGLYHSIAGSTDNAYIDMFRLMPGDFNGDGKVDIYVVNGWGSNAVDTVNLSDRVSDSISTFTNGLGSQIAAYYAPITDNSIYKKTGTAASSAQYPYLDSQNATYVVGRYSVSNGIGGTNSTTYTYYDLKFHITAVQSLGFGLIESTGPDGLVTKTYQNQNLDGTEGTTYRAETIAGGVKIKESTDSWVPVNFGDGRTLALNTNGVLVTRELDGSLITQVTTTNTHDEYGFPTKAVTDSGDGYVKTVTNTYQHDTSSWRLGRLIQASVKADAPSGNTQIRTSSFTYYPNGLIASETIEPASDTPLRLATAYGYDVFGNRTSKAVSGLGIEARTEYQNFDARGERIVGRINALDHTETLSYEDSPYWGAKKSLTGPNGLTTTWTYDGFGRQVREDRADGTATVVEYAWAPNGGYSTHTTASGAAEVWVFYDILGRQIRSATQGFGGNWIDQDTTYDALGRVVSASHPYLEGTPPHAACSTYDVLGRVLTTTSPCGSDRTVVTTYAGLCTAVKNSVNPVAKTVCKNSQGKMISATDAGGTTTYEYDAYSNLTKVTDPLGNEVTMQYDLRGRKIAMNDPDMGAWSYGYDALGQLKTQTDAKGQTTTMAYYDKLGRLRTRVAPEGTSTWTYDTALHGIGKLAEMKSPAGDAEVYTYDDKGRLSTVKTVIGGEDFIVTTDYDTNSRVDTITYPQTGYKTKNVYDNYGHLWQVLDVTGNPSLVWQIGPGGLDDHGRIRNQQFGNGAFSIRDYVQEKDDLKRITTDSSAGPIQDLAYTFDAIGNLKSRGNNVMGFAELFSYDDLNRLTYVSGPASRYIAYDAIGNIKSKSDVGTYAYPMPRNPRPHAVSSIELQASGSGTTSSVTLFDYDDNGNMLSGMGRTVSYTSFNKPASVRVGQADTSYFTYDANYNRIRKATPNTTTLYVGKLYEKTIRNGTTIEHKHYVYAGKMLVAFHTEQIGQSGSGGTVSSPRTQYVHTDHLGSVNVITDENGNVVERLSYDVHGKRRNANGTDVGGQTPSQVTTRGFTGHEHDDEVGLINMNARLYDPVIGRFPTPDTFVQFPSDSQGLNRYSYVNNNPLYYTDPSGHFALKDVVNKLKSGLARFTGGTLGRVSGVPIIGGYASIGLLTTDFGLWYGWSTGDWTSVGRAHVQGSIIAGTAMAGNWASTTFRTLGEKVIAHGVIGGTSSVLSGGSFRDGALAAGFATYAGTQLPNDATSQFVGRVIIGGIAAEIGGGKFKNGATTAAFTYLLFDDRNSTEDGGSCFLRGCSSQSGASATTEFSIGEKDFSVVGGTAEDRAMVQSDLKEIFATPRGREMLAALESRRFLFVFRTSFMVDLTIVNTAYAYLGQNAVYVDPNWHPEIDTTAGPLRATTQRIIAHELGHAVFSTRDPSNVYLNENPVMNALGQPSRVGY